VEYWQRIVIRGPYSRPFLIYSDGCEWRLNDMQQSSLQSTRKLLPSLVNPLDLIYSRSQDMISRLFTVLFSLEKNFPIKKKAQTMKYIYLAKCRTGV
jgi:hypothetical protein